MTRPKIDYTLLGRAAHAFHMRGFDYVEVPWTADEDAIRATLPKPHDALQLAYKEPLMGPDGLARLYGRRSNLVGSAEQGFLDLRLPAGRYYGVTPCFRMECVSNAFYQDMFMKLELHDSRPGADHVYMVNIVLDWYYLILPDGKFTLEETEEGIDIMLNGIEVGSFGCRSHKDFGSWVYGTGLALPRFSEAAKLSRS